MALLDAQGREALQLPRAVAALSPRSLLRFGFEQIYIEGPELDMRRERDGRIVIAGLAFRDSARATVRRPIGCSPRPRWRFAAARCAGRDEQRRAEPLALTEVIAVLRQTARRRRQVRLDATPPPEWGAPFTLRGQFRQPLLSTHSGDLAALERRAVRPLPARGRVAPAPARRSGGAAGGAGPGRRCARGWMCSAARLAGGHGGHGTRRGQRYPGQEPAPTGAAHGDGAGGGSLAG